MVLFPQLVLFVIGFLLLYNGAEWIVEGASILANKIGLSPILIGLTVVAFGTSTPELIVSIVSSSRDKNMIAIGNIVGSNICNFTLILGIIAMIKPIAASKIVIKQDIPIMILSSICLFMLSINSKISSINGLILFIGIIIYIFFSYHRAKNAKKDLNVVKRHLVLNHKNYQVKTQLFIILFGIMLLVIGSELLLNASIKIMIALGFSEKCVGLTIVALGTSIPELVTSLVAIAKKQIGILIGNLVGSNLFNTLSVIGITAIIQPIKIDPGFIESGLIIDYAVMIFTSSLPLFLLSKGRSITFLKGVVLFLIYASYFIILFIRT